MKNIRILLIAWSGNLYFFKDPGSNPPHIFDLFSQGFESSSNHAQLDKSPPPARPFALAGGRFVGRGYLVMAIYPLTMAGLVPLPKQCSHVNQLTFVFGPVIAKLFSFIYFKILD